MPRTLTGADGTIHVFPEQATDQEIAGLLGVGPDELAGMMNVDTSRIPISGHTRGRPKRKSALPYAADIGGGIGGLLGHPGAALGGGIGEAVNRLATDIPHALNTGEGVNPMETIGSIAEEAGKQAALNWAGGVVGKGIGKVGKPLMAAALKASPEIAQIAIREGIAATRKGVEKLGSKIGDISHETGLLMQRIGRSGVKLDTQRLADDIELDVLTELGHSSTSANKIPELNRIKSRFLQGPGKMHPEKAHEYFQSANKAAEPQFIRAANGQKILLPTDPVEQLWKAAEAKRIGAALESATGYVGPGGARGSRFAELNARQHELLKLKGVLDPDEVGVGGRLAQQGLSRGAAAATGATLGAAAPGNRGQNAALGATVGALAGSPQGLSHFALLLNNPIMQQLLLRQIPRGLSAAAPEEQVVE